jgi:hypothetical protein
MKLMNRSSSSGGEDGNEHIRDLLMVLLVRWKIKLASYLHGIDKLNLEDGKQLCSFLASSQWTFFYDTHIIPGLIWTKIIIRSPQVNGRGNERAYTGDA